jgi:aminocarboxymuconate-semialdehyde decarboxylase
MSVVDVHAHVLLPSLQGMAQTGDPAGFLAAGELETRRNGPESQATSGAMVRDRFGRLTQVPLRLADMDAQGVDVQIVSPSPSHYYPWAGPELALALAREASRLTAEHIAARPDRLRGLGLVPLQHPDLLVEALDYAVVELGLAGVEISSSAGEVELSDPRLEPFWARAAQLEAIIFVHPFGCTLDERLDRFYLSNTVGQPTENAVALSHLIFSGVLDRHPTLRIIAAHGGGYLPTHIGRSDHAWRVRPEARGCEHPPSTYLRRLWFDSLVHDPETLRTLIAAAGVDRVLLGSDYPFDMGTESPVADLRASGLDDAVQQAILADNVRHLLPTVEVATP